MRPNRLYLGNFEMDDVDMEDGVKGLEKHCQILFDNPNLWQEKLSAVFEKYQAKEKPFDKIFWNNINYNTPISVIKTKFKRIQNTYSQSNDGFSQ